eukprot:TRINITY_DN5220_c0_g1_i1.p1 TRINITY_DN5220_c0_g1~~TRINITY_DN5220_c0_g1_i1.p1  ORF type:complete len:329 (+),score=40.72 TRINITY_DN5220_c0_g1_i1:51-1037(+)
MSLCSKRASHHLDKPLLDEDDSTTLRRRAIATGIGIAAISMWSSSIAAARLAAKCVGAITSMGICNTIGGMLAIALYAVNGKLPGMLRNPWSYYLHCGVPFVLYQVFLFIAFHYAQDDMDIVTLTAVNYLWPLLMSLLTVVIMKKEANMGMLVLTGMMAIYCILLVNLPDAMPMTEMLLSFQHIIQATGWAAAGAYCWACYSINAAYFSEHHQTQTAVPLFTFASGIANLCITRIPEFHEEANGPFDYEFMLPMMYLTLVPILGCRFAWDYACSNGNILFLTSCAYFMPVLAMLWNIVLLGVTFTENVAFGSFGLALAALAAKLAFRK